MSLDTLTGLLQDLIRIPSPNPPGETRAVAEFCEHFLQKAGFTTQLVAPDERAWSVVGEIGNDDGPTIIYHAHIDTVPLGRNARWSYDPFAGEIDNGRIYGLGSVDDKAPLAAMLYAGSFLAERADDLHGRLVIVCAADEEVGGQLGTRWLADNGYLPPADFAVVGEQTHNRVATAHKGVLRAAFHVAGRTSHATDPWRGRNAINGMAHLILDIERYQRDVLESRPHPLLGPASINVGLIEGGVGSNVVADHCTIRVDRRMIPGEDPRVVMDELRALAAGRQAEDDERTYTVDSFLVSNWFETDAENEYTQRFLAISAELTATPAEPIGYLPGSDAKHLVDVVTGGMVVFGPGSYQVAHSTDEYTDVQELAATGAILRRFLDQTLFR
ncbi:MAG: M20 family metallopeptidase [Caldilineaceae bacterium]|nr:M20 family metallopeptidase [Caldilineaceae bacterium]